MTEDQVWMKLQIPRKKKKWLKSYRRSGRKLKKRPRPKLSKPKAPAPTYTDATSKDTKDIADLIDKLG